MEFFILAPLSITEPVGLQLNLLPDLDPVHSRPFSILGCRSGVIAMCRNDAGKAYEGIPTEPTVVLATETVSSLRGRDF